MGNRFIYFRNAALLSQKIVGSNFLFSTLEQRLINKDVKQTKPPIFIIGPPRTGSTLLFQLLLLKYKFAYLTNLQAFFHGSPVLMGKICHYWISKRTRKTSLSSQYGYIKGLFSPSEAGIIYRKWFGEADFVACEPTVKKELVFRSVCHLTGLFGAPFLSKNLNNSLRLKRIIRIFPDAVFIWITRDPLYTAQSLLLMRQSLYGSMASWASVKPEAWEKVQDLSPFEQVVWQVKSINDYIGRVFDGAETEKLIHISYEQLCKNPEAALQKIKSFYDSVTGLALEDQHIRVPNIELKDGRRLNNREWEKLEMAIKDFFNEQKY